MKASEHALTLLKHFEGLSTKAYICPAGVLTVGYGHTGRDVKPGMVITAAQAENLLRRDVEHFENGLTKFLNLDGIYVTQGQFDALLCFSYNLGLRALISSTLWSKLQKNDYKGTAQEFDKWVYAREGKTGKKVKMQGLVSRRQAERRLFEEE